MARFNVGQVVAPISNPELSGAIIEIISGDPEDRYVVFHGPGTQIYYEIQIQLYEKAKAERIAVPLTEFHAYLSALQINHPALSTLYSLNSAKVDFIPYQFRPVLKFIRSDRPRLLIADSVGVGKTIEAGFILREMQARHDTQSVLIICPKPLVTEEKWLSEMRRFDEEFTHLDGKTLRYCINETDRDGIWPAQHTKTIVPYSLFNEDLLIGNSSRKQKKRIKGLIQLEPPPHFELVIVDEAHHIRNKDTYAYQAVRFFCDNADAVVFLTATPIQLGDRDLYTLLNVLRPDLVIDESSFKHMSEPNEFINRAISLVRTQKENWQEEALQSLHEAVNTNWGQSIILGSLDYDDVVGSLSKEDININERVQCIDKLEQLHTFSGIINRTRRMDIGDFTTRKPETVYVEFTPEQQELHDTILNTQAKVLSRIHGNQNVKFMMTTLRRRTASCLFGLAPFLEEVLTRHLGKLASSDEGFDDFDTSAIDEINIQIHQILEKAKQLNPNNDPKLKELCRIVDQKQSLPNNKLMIYSSFRHTLDYLFKKLVKDGYRVGMVHGGVKDEDRRTLRHRFMQKDRNTSDTLDVLLFSEVGTEGLDYQFCDCLVNYDLPWNPMRIEQRIGRLDRKGQESEALPIYNFVTPGTVDADIYERCLERIGVFHRSLGECEAILGDITREIGAIAEDFTLTPEERRTQLAQIADNDIRLIQENQKLEEAQIELFGIRTSLEKMEEDVENARSYWLSPRSLENMVMLYLKELCGQEQERLQGKGERKTLRLSQEDRSLLLKDFQNLPRSNTIINREWNSWLKGGEQRFLVTFDAEYAKEDRTVTLLTPVHPLIRQAARHLGSECEIFTALSVKCDDMPSGDYPFAIYQWRYHGIYEDLVLKPICNSNLVSSRLLELLQSGTPITLEERDAAPLSFDDLESSHYQLWQEARRLHTERTRRRAEFRRESLTTSQKARMAVLEDQLESASHENIRNMRRSQINSANADYERRTKELNTAVEKADIISQPIAFGIVRVEGR